ncbi:L-2,4-diaminobutyrate decarboxylase [Raoultella planticola]|uniref:L-2,4-diaminobutyrate decarboxylase n=1 Tax=Raoultella planticola TaxID=575 RepID=A0A485CWI6_RAOPL|nr:L-2,4-diaminobutyrate decarboxylase [Raoultella planticola]
MKNTACRIWSPKSLQTTRRFDALKLWMGLEALGQKQYAEIIDHGVTMAKNVAQYVTSQPTLELVMQAAAGERAVSALVRRRWPAAMMPLSALLNQPRRGCAARFRSGKRRGDRAQRHDLPEADAG